MARVAGLDDHAAIHTQALSSIELQREGAEIQSRIEVEHPLEDSLRAKLLDRLDS